MIEENLELENEEFENNIQENLQLKAINSQLQLDIQSLQQQFNDSLQIIQNLQSINNENMKLKQELIKLKSDHEDLNQRFQLSLLANEKLNTKSLQIVDIGLTEEKFQIREEEYENKLSQFEFELNQSQNLYQKEKSQNSMNELNIQMILEASTLYFQENLTIDTLIKKLSKKPVLSIKKPQNCFNNC